MKRMCWLLCCLGILGGFLQALPSSDRAGRKTPPLRVGIMPDVDSLPLMVARDEGFFQQEGAAVELIPFFNPQERDAAIQAGRLDVAISDLLAAAFFTAGGFDMKVTSLTDGCYGIVSSPQSRIQNLKELRGKRIGLSANTIIQYTVDAQLEAAGVPMTEYETVSVPRMPLRLEMVLTGQIDAAGLPEPLLTAAVAQGAVLLSDTGATGIDVGVFLVSKKVLDQRLEEVRKFYRAYYKAAQKINANPDAYREYLVKEAAFPVAIKDAYRFIPYRKPALPEVSQIDSVLGWLTRRNLLKANLSAEDLVDKRAIEGW